MLKILSITSSLVAVVVLTGCTSFLIKDEFMNSCEKGSSPDYCKCAFDEIKKAYSDEEVEAMVMEHRMPSGYINVIMPCHKKEVLNQY